jgi:hypothetical protein
MIKFKSTDSRIDLSQDKFYNKVIKILTKNKYPLILMGSYNKYGKDKSCDLDLINTLTYDGLNECIDQIIYASSKYKKNLIITRIKFNMEDERILAVMTSLGYLDNEFNIIDYNLNISSELSITIKDNIIKLANKYQEKNNLIDYINLYLYVKSLVSPIWKITDLEKRKLEFNNIKYNIDDFKFTSLMIEMLYHKYPVSYKVYIGKKPIMDRTKYPVKLSSILFNNQIDYYKLLKKFQTFLKWAFYNIIRDYNFKNYTVILYNKIHDFRESVGIYNHKLCKYQAYQQIDHNQQVNNKVLKYFNLLNDKSKEIYVNEAIKYKELLNKYFIIKP